MIPSASTGESGKPIAGVLQDRNDIHPDHSWSWDFSSLVSWRSHYHQLLPLRIPHGSALCNHRICFRSDHTRHRHKPAPHVGSADKKGL